MVWVVGGQARVWSEVGMPLWAATEGAAVIGSVAFMGWLLLLLLPVGRHPVVAAYKAVGVCVV